MITGIVSSTKRSIGNYIQYAKEAQDVVCELDFLSTPKFNAKFAYYQTHFDSTANDSSVFDLIFTYFNLNLTYAEDTNTFTPDDTNINKLKEVCDVLFWENQFTDPLKIIQDTSNLGADIVAKRAAFMQTRYPNL